MASKNMVNFFLGHPVDINSLFLFIATQRFPTSHQEVYSILTLNAGFKFCLNILYLQHQAQYFSNLDI